MQCLGEMIAHLPVSGGHITLARRFVGNEMAFAVGKLPMCSQLEEQCSDSTYSSGWLYWYNWTIVLRKLKATSHRIHTLIHLIFSC